MTKREMAWYAAGLSMGIVVGCPRPPKPDAAIIRPDDRAAVVVAPDKVSIVERGQAPAAKYIPPEGKVTVRVKKDGVVVVAAKTRGFCFAPGVGAASFGGTPAVGPLLDVKFAYWGRLGLTAGVGLTGRTAERIYFAPTWQVYRNTAAGIGFTTAQRPIILVRISF